jgi:hypothetical protein
MQIALYILAAWFGFGLLGGLTLIGTTMVNRRSNEQLPPSLTAGVNAVEAHAPKSDAGDVRT